MERQDRNDEDLLKIYLNPEKIEKAPSGFTSKTMTRIQIEASSAKALRGIFRNNPVPVISAMIIFALIITAIFVPAGQADTLSIAVSNYLKNFNFSFPGLDISPVQNFHIPGWMLYAFVGIILLVLFDRVLSGVFHKEEK